MLASIHDSVALPFRGARRLAMLWLVVALLVQGLVTQTHAHFTADAYATATASARATVAAVDVQKDTPATPACPMCEEKALFGAYLLGGTIAIAAPLESAYHYAAASLPLLALSASSHAWQSRAPPVPTA